MSTFPHQPNTTLQIDIEMKPWNKIHIQNGVEQKVLEMLKTPLFQFEIYCCGVWLPCQGRKCKMSTKENTFGNNYCAKYFYNLEAWHFFPVFFQYFHLNIFNKRIGRICTWDLGIGIEWHFCISFLPHALSHHEALSDSSGAKLARNVHIWKMKWSTCKVYGILNICWLHEFHVTTQLPSFVHWPKIFGLNII